MLSKQKGRGGGSVVALRRYSRVCVSVLAFSVLFVRVWFALAVPRRTRSFGGVEGGEERS